MPIHAIGADHASLRAGRLRRSDGDAGRDARRSVPRPTSRSTITGMNERAGAAHDELLRAQPDDVDVDAEVPEELARGHVAEVEQQRRHERERCDERREESHPLLEAEPGSGAACRRLRRPPMSGGGVDRLLAAAGRRAAPSGASGVFTTSGGPGSTSRAATTSQISAVGHSSVPVKVTVVPSTKSGPGRTTMLQKMPDSFASTVMPQARAIGAAACRTCRPRRRVPR